MQILPLGGAGEVGASCYLLEIAGAQILIDSGVRVGSGAQRNPLPAHALLEQAPDALIVTHAHTDHTGSLPLVIERTGETAIHMTIATLHLVQVLQRDAVRMMSSDEREADVGGVLYTADDVERMLSQVQTHRYYTPFCPVRGRADIVMEYVPCGHILGAGSLIIESPEKKVLWLGDYSLSPQPTIGGLDLEYLRKSAAVRPFDLVVSEGTYGLSGAHPDRRKEAARFISLLERTAKKNGKTLIPSFALGRSQDIVHVIRAAKLRGRLKDVPVYLDGMVRPVTSIYENITHEMYPTRSEPLQLLDPELGIFKANGQSRAKILAGEVEGPAIIIASSGMLIGGQSVRYAKALIGDKRNSILISGYQDEMSPGRALLGLKRGKPLRLGEEKVRVKCQVGRYHTSAHADSEQIFQVIEAVDAKKVALIHGDAAALEALREKLGKRRTVVLENEVSFQMGRKRNWSSRIAAAEVMNSAALPAERMGPTPSEVQVREVWSTLIAEGERDYAETEIASRFLGGGYTSEERETLSVTLADHRLYFIPGSRLGQRSYRPRSQEELIDMIVERGNAFQAKLEVGDVVVFSDGAPDLYVALITRVTGAEIEALVPFSSRRSFRRDWYRAHTGINLANLLRQHGEGYLYRWLAGVVREARNLPPFNPVDLYYEVRAREIQGISGREALEIWCPEREGVFSSAMQIAGALALAGCRSLFSLRGDGRMYPREEAEVSARWKLFPKIHYLRSLGEGEAVHLVNGQRVIPTGVLFSDSFEARTESGAFTRCSFRRVQLPWEVVLVEEEDEEVVAAAESAPAGKGRKRRRRGRRRGGAGSGRGEEVAKVVAADAGAPSAPGKRRRRRSRRGGGARPRAASPEPLATPVV